MKLILQTILNIVALMITTYIIPGFVVDSLWAAFVTVVILAILNLFIKPLLLLITLPINVLTLGLFTFIINAVLLMIASSIVPGFTLASWSSAIWGAIILALISAVFSAMSEDGE